VLGRLTLLTHQDRPQGFECLICSRSLCQNVSGLWRWYVKDWDGLIPGFESCVKFDANYLASMSITEERLKVVDFTNKYYCQWLTPSWGVLVRNSISKPEGKQLGAQRANLAHQFLEDNSPDKADLKF